VDAVVMGAHQGERRTMPLSNNLLFPHNKTHHEGSTEAIAKWYFPSTAAVRATVVRLVYEEVRPAHQHMIKERGVTKGTGNFI